MKTNETIFTDESGLKRIKTFDGNAFGEPAESSIKTPTPRLVKIGAAGVTGLVIGAAGIALTSAAPADDDEELVTGIVFEEEDEDEPIEELEVEETTASTPTIGHIGNVDYAEGVNDDMTFAEAFATARAEVGPGGAFEWHGNIYGTYTAQEWESMTDAEQQAYANQFGYTGEHHDTDNVAATNASTGASEEAPAEHTGARETQTPTESGSDDEADIEVLEIVQNAETGQSYVAMNVNGHETYMIDEDGDGVLDIIISDLNDNQELDEGESADISSEGITIEQISGNTGVEITYYGEEAAPADEPEYEYPVDELSDTDILDI